jgi:tetratricopeptide (TPR) repeat protein
MSSIVSVPSTGWTPDRLGPQRPVARRRRFASAWPALARLLVGLLAAAAAAAQEPGFAGRLDSARKLIDERAYGQARIELANAVALAESLGQRAWAGRSESSIGLSWQIEAQGDTLLTSDRDSLLVLARVHYERALEFDPDWGPALNNLGQLYCEQGQHDRGRSLLRRATRLNSDRWALYMVNYAHCSLSAGDWREARRFLLQVVDSLPDDPDVQQTVWAIYLKRDLDGVGEYLWRTLKRGQPRKCISLAIEFLRRPEETPSRLREEVCMVLALALGSTGFDPTGESAGAAAESLLSLVNDPDLGAMASETIRLHEGQSLDPGQFPWWASRDRRLKVGELEESPREAFRMLADALGQLHESLGSATQAERYYRLAIDLAPGAAQPMAVRHLADLLARQGRAGDLRLLVTEQSRLVDEGKDAGYGADDWKNVYLFHRTVGEILTTADSASIEDTTLTSGYHLETAQVAVTRFNRIASKERRNDTLVVDTSLVRMVAQQQSKLDVHGSVQVQRSAAEQYIHQKRFIEAREVLHMPPGVTPKDSLEIVKLRARAKDKP